MIVYVASKSPNPAYALHDGNLIEVCAYGPDPGGDAKSYAKDHTKSTDENAYVYAVSLSSVVGYKIQKEVTTIATF